jgi:hypothetical protein
VARQKRWMKSEKDPGDQAGPIPRLHPRKPIDQERIQYMDELNQGHVRRELQPPHFPHPPVNDMANWSEIEWIVSQRTEATPKCVKSCQHRVCEVVQVIIGEISLIRSSIHDQE